MSIYTPEQVQLTHHIQGRSLCIEQSIQRSSTNRWETVRSRLWARPNQVVLESVETHMSVNQRRFTHHFTHYLNIEAAEAFAAHLQRCIASAKAQAKEQP